MDSYRTCRICQRNTQEYIRCICNEFYCITHQSQDFRQVQGCCISLLNQLWGLEEITYNIAEMLSPIMSTLFHIQGMMFTITQIQIQQNQMQNTPTVQQSSNSSSSNYQTASQLVQKYIMKGRIQIMIKVQTMAMNNHRLKIQERIHSEFIYL